MGFEPGKLSKISMHFKWSINSDVPNVAKTLPFWKVSSFFNKHHNNFKIVNGKSITVKFYVTDSHLSWENCCAVKRHEIDIDIPFSPNCIHPEIVTSWTLCVVSSPDIITSLFNSNRNYFLDNFITLFARKWLRKSHSEWEQAEKRERCSVLLS